MAEEKAVPELCGEDVVKVAERIRARHHPELRDAVIAYVFIPKAPIRGGRASLGSASKESAVHRLVSRVDFIIRLSKDRWELLEPQQQEALLDHELSHCVPKLDEDGERVDWEMRHHDLEEFTEIVARHGLWKEDVEAFAEAVKQLRLFKPTLQGQEA